MKDKFINITFKKKIIINLLIIIFLFIIYVIWQNSSLVVTTYDINNSKLPQSFNGFTIVQVSDLHNKEFGEDNIKLLSKIAEQRPDIIVITGDIIDRRKYNLEKAIKFTEQAVKIAPVYYVSGNHEAWSYKNDEISFRLIQSGVNIIDDQKVEIKKLDQSISLIGLSDPGFLSKENTKRPVTYKMEQSLDELIKNDEFNIVLSHRQSLIDLYSQKEADLVFSGHAHGGQIRLPIIGPIIAPDEGFFPKYTSGVYEKENTSLVVSRGLGSSIIPIRINNKPEIVVVTLNK